MKIFAEILRAGYSIVGKAGQMPSRLHQQWQLKVPFPYLSFFQSMGRGIDVDNIHTENLFSMQSAKKAGK